VYRRVQNEQYSIYETSAVLRLNGVRLVEEASGAESQSARPLVGWRVVMAAMLIGGTIGVGLFVLYRQRQRARRRERQAHGEGIGPGLRGLPLL
jgi:hypothetical protein